MLSPRFSMDVLFISSFNRSCDILKLIHDPLVAIPEPSDTSSTGASPIDVTIFFEAAAFFVAYKEYMAVEGTGRR